MSALYEVLNPWAEVDPIPLRGISPRLTELKGKTIGLFANNKHASRPVLSVVETKLKGKYPTLKFSRYEIVGDNLEICETEGKKEKTEFEKWVKRIDAIIGAVGD